MILNIGCGCFSLGDVNGDLFIGNTPHDLLQFINPKKIKNFVKLDGCFLPFKNNCFELVISNHVIEHIVNPFLFLKEMVRVSKNRIKITCPHRFGDRFYQLFLRRKNKVHIHYFNAKWFEIEGKKLNCFVIIKYSGFVNLPFINFLPNELEIKMVKGALRK